MCRLIVTNLSPVSKQFAAGVGQAADDHRVHVDGGGDNHGTHQSPSRPLVAADPHSCWDGSVLQWYTSEMRGSGDLRFYAAVQVYSALVLLLALFLPQRYTRGSALAFVVGFYALAKV